MVERDTNVPLKALQTDNGREYTSDEFEEHCMKHGIFHEKMELGTPQYSGVAERMYRTIVEKVISILRVSKFPKAF